MTRFWCASVPGIRPCRSSGNFPAAKLKRANSRRDALRRELNEELGIDAIIGEEVARIRHEYKSGSAVELRFYAVRDYRGELENKIFKDMRWAVRSDLPSFDFLEADLQLVQRTGRRENRFERKGLSRSRPEASRTRPGSMPP